MVYNCFIKCQVCGKITRVRLQVGWLSEHPIVVTCGECKTSLSGKVIIGQEAPGLDFSFENAEVVNDENADYMVECSGEFPVMKQRMAEDPLTNPISPFIRAMNRMDSDDAYEEFCKSVGSLKNTKEKWSQYKRILDLSKDLNNEYLVKEIRKIFDESLMPCKNELEVLRAVHMIEIHGFIEPLRKDVLDNIGFSEGILKLDKTQTKELIDFLDRNSGYGLRELQLLSYKVMDEFLRVFPALIPAFSMQYCKNGNVDFESEGSTTSNFDTVKQFYLDVYEALGNLLIIPVALNNIKYRNDYDNLNPLDSRNTTLSDFIGLTKAARYKYCLDSEMYSDKLNIIVNSKLRNAIGHNDVEYDTASQRITYIPNPKDRTRSEEEYLLEFENEALRLFQGLLIVAEYLYRLRELQIIRGMDVNEVTEYMNRISRMPGISSTRKKIYPNDPCPCGSGKKYKKCCGYKM